MSLFPKAIGGYFMEEANEKAHVKTNHEIETHPLPRARFE